MHLSGKYILCGRKTKAQYFPADICLMVLIVENCLSLPVCWCGLDLRYSFNLKEAVWFLLFNDRISSRQTCKEAQAVHNMGIYSLLSFQALSHIILIRSWILTATSKSKDVAVHVGFGKCGLIRVKCLPGRKLSTASSTTSSVSSQLDWPGFSSWTFQRKDCDTLWWNVEPEWLDTHFGVRGSSISAGLHFITY
jgi:hypothetical protein